jgi:RNA polymerase sigma-70 factor (ECF subfamily)
MLRDASDATLAELAREGNKDAIAEAYRRHSSAVYGHAMRVIKDPALAEDVSQEIFVRLWQRPERFDPNRGSLRSFLLADTHGRSIDLIRSVSSRRMREEKEARLTAEAGRSLEEEVWDLNRAEMVRDALSNLGEGERVAIELAYFGGYTYRQVADKLGEPEGTVKSRIRSGLKRLDSALAVHGVTTA